MSDAPAIFSRARQLVDPVIAELLVSLCDELRIPAEYHFGSRGKGIRPALAVLSAEAVGAPAETALPGAVAIELVHDFSLLHDDIIDGDTERRHRTTVWAKFGTGSGIILGDALHTLAFESLLAEPTPQRVQAARMLASASAAMIAGQSLDMAFDDRLDVTLQECLDMERGKTGALLSYASAVGAVLAAAEQEIVDGLAEYGMQLGLAFQAVDDMLGIWGDPERTGKPAGSDLRERKRSVPVTIALHSDTPEAVELARLYTQSHLDEAEVAEARRLVERTGACESTEQLARFHYEQALDVVRSLPITPGAADGFLAVAEFTVGRDF